ncbi:MAG: hypothetical protein AAF321_00725, partial [Pseudomonadota bacterium]
LGACRGDGAGEDRIRHGFVSLLAGFGASSAGIGEARSFMRRLAAFGKRMFDKSIVTGCDGLRSGV